MLVGGGVCEYIVNAVNFSEDNIYVDYVEIDG